MAVGMESDVKSLEDLQEKTLLSCHDILKKKLDVKEVFSPMNEKNLLTLHDKHILSDTSNSVDTKVLYIIDILPRKGKGWWENFIASLRESTSGTAHEYLASTLTSRLKRRMHDCGKQTLENRERVRNSYSAHVPSGISLDMDQFMPDVLPDTRYSESKEEKPDITNLRPDLADIINPIVKLKEELDKTKHHYRIMQNQVGLLQAFDELIENTKCFQDALSDLLKLYINSFKTRKQHGYSKLTMVECELIQIIEDITESTEDIDIDKETQIWEQCVEKMEKNHKHIKEALYSQDTTRMAAIQQTWKLSGAGAEDAKEWIKVRRQVVELGYESLDKLNDMRSQDDALITSVYDIVHRRVKVGKDCLEAWIKWVQQRSEL